MIERGPQRTPMNREQAAGPAQLRDIAPNAEALRVRRLF